MRKRLKNKKIVFGITGSVAAYKAVDIIRRLKDEEASVTAVMTDASMHFITPLSVELASGNKVLTGLFGDPLAHIALAAEADIALVAPATANIIGKFAQGIADDLLSTFLLAFQGKVVLVPAMNWRMYESPAVRRNLALLKAQGVAEVIPDNGQLACGEAGRGRMAELDAILDAVECALTEQDLAGRKVVVTAGPTREHIDSVRFITNRSSGKMGYALAVAARRRGAEVVLISGPSSLKAPHGICTQKVETASEMRDAVMAEIKDTWALLMAAAVSDFRPEGPGHQGKLKKSDVLEIRLALCPDILTEVGAMKRKPVLVGFAADTSIERAREKFLSKGADIIVFNNISEPDSGFEVDTNRITILSAESETGHPLLTKTEAADVILDSIAQMERA